MNSPRRILLVLGLLVALSANGRPATAQAPSSGNEAARQAEIQQHFAELTAKLEKFSESLRARQPERADALTERLHRSGDLKAPLRLGSLQRLISSLPELENNAERPAIAKLVRKLTHLLGTSSLQQQKDLRVQLEGLIDGQNGVRDELVKLMTAWGSKPEVTAEQRMLLAKLQQQQSTISRGVAEAGDRLARILGELGQVDSKVSSRAQLSNRMEQCMVLLWVIGGDASEVATYVPGLGDKDLKPVEREEMGQDIEIQLVAMSATLQKIQKEMITQERFQEVVLTVQELDGELDDVRRQLQLPED